MVPAVGSRFESRPHRGARRVYELVQTIPERTLSTGSDRYTLRVIAEEGFMPSCSYGIGWELHVEDAWFHERRQLLRAVPS